MKSPAVSEILKPVHFMMHAAAIEVFHAAEGIRAGC